jgi:hypothetical protein
MSVTFFDREDDANYLNGTIIRDRNRLFQILKDLRSREPFVCELVGDNGYRLDVGVGDYGCVQHCRIDGDPPYRMAVNRSTEGQVDEYIEFLLGGTGTPISKRYCMPFDSVLEIAGYFLETGRMHPAVAWDEI